MMLRSLFLLSVLLVSCFSAASDPGDILLADLKLRHYEALQLSLSSPESGRKAHATVAARLESLFADPTLDQATMAYNIGNSWYLAGQYGYSLLWLRRAELLDRHDPQLQQNMAYVRSQRIDNLPALFGSPWLTTLYSWSGSVWWLGICSLAYLLFWWQLWCFIRGGFVQGSRLLGVSVLMLVILSSQVFRIVYTPAESDGVITVREVVARKGPGLIYNPAFTSLLNQGTEFILLQQDNDWAEVTFSNGEKAWLPNSAIAFIAGK